MAGYHLTEIPRGKFGEVSKILEEVAGYQFVYGTGLAEPRASHALSRVT
jgi:hypothetical protein